MLSCMRIHYPHPKRERDRHPHLHTCLPVHRQMPSCPLTDGHLSVDRQTGLPFVVALCLLHSQ